VSIGRLPRLGMKKEMLGYQDSDIKKKYNVFTFLWLGLDFLFRRWRYKRRHTSCQKSVDHEQ
jgi:hypothetical protein